MKIEEFVGALRAMFAKLDPDEEPTTAEAKFGEILCSFAAGVETEVEVARSGSFVDMNKQAVEVTPALLKSLAGSLDLEKHEPKLKLGHEPIKTDTPDLGSVVGLSYDEGKDRLMAKIRPTLALVKRIRDGSFNQRSMEFAMNPKTGEARFLHLGFLGARRPAITGLAAVSLSEPADGAKVTVLFTDPEPELDFCFGMTTEARKAVPDDEFAGPNRTFPISSPEHLDAAASLLHHAADPTAVKAKAMKIAKKKGYVLPATWSDASMAAPEPAEGLDSTARNDIAHKEKEKMTDAAKKERTDAIVKAACEDRVTAFLASNLSRIPVDVVKMVKDGMPSLLLAETDMEAPEFVALAAAEGVEPKKISASAFIFAMLAKLPEQITEAEKKKTPEGVEEPATEDASKLAEFAGCEPTSIAVHLAAKAEQAEAEKAGTKITYLEGARRAEAKGRK